MTNQDDNNQEIEKVEDVEVEKQQRRRQIRMIRNKMMMSMKSMFYMQTSGECCRKMIELPNHICVCNDCMQKSFDAMSNGPIDYSQLMNIPGVQVFNMSDMEQSIPKQQKIKKKKEGRRIQAVSRYPESSGSAQDQGKTGRVCGRTGICKESDVGCSI